MAKQIVFTEDAPKAIGPYSQAVRAGNLLFVSGQIPIDPKSAKVNLFDGDVSQQTRLALNNLRAILKSQNLSLDHLVKTTVYLTEMEDFATMNQVYEEFLGESKPARATVAVKKLPAGVAVEIEAIAFLD